jgi:hypothetical protein
VPVPVPVPSSGARRKCRWQPPANCQCASHASAQTQNTGTGFKLSTVSHCQWQCVLLPGANCGDLLDRPRRPEDSDCTVLMGQPGVSVCVRLSLWQMTTVSRKYKSKSEMPADGGREKRIEKSEKLRKKGKVATACHGGTRGFLTAVPRPSAPMH